MLDVNIKGATTGPTFEPNRLVERPNDWGAGVGTNSFAGTSDVDTIEDCPQDVFSGVSRPVSTAAAQVGVVKAGGTNVLRVTFFGRQTMADRLSRGRCPRF